jgi:glycosyltransferase involved in cell wall biosynthesis
MRLQNRYQTNSWTEEEIERVAGWEAVSWEKSDLILYPSQEEVEEVRATRPDREVAVLPLSCVPEEEIAQAITKTPFYKRHGLLFVGGFAHKPNKDAILWFLDHVFPEILKEFPGMKVVIAGSDPPEEVRSLESSSVRVLGRISDEELRDCHSKVRLTIAPLRIGAGVKGKVVESLKMGVPVATTSIGIQGLEGAERAIAVGDTPSELARAVISLHTDEEKWTAFRNEGVRYYQEHFSSGAVCRQVLPLLER